MACEICGRSSCTRSFHSLEEQESFDNIKDKVNERLLNEVKSEVSKLDGHYHGNNYYVRYDDILNILDKLY